MKVCPQCKQRYPHESSFCFVDGASLEPLPDPRLGTTVAGIYVLEQVLGVMYVAFLVARLANLYNGSGMGRK